ncbi:MAG: hypothetical protein KIG36_06895, partial [Eubacteriales bacterium]|nr:hypothetical protein [Eubacteriales bacterium]
VRRGNQVWSGTGAVYFGELALVNGGVQELIPNKPGDHMNFVVLNGLNSLNGLTGITFPYTSSPDITLALEENGANNDEYHFQFNESNYAIFKFQNMGLPQTIAALDPSAVALGFYVRVGSEDVAIWQLQIPEGGTLYAAEDWKLFDLSGNEVLFAAANHTIPAGFEGYVYIPNATASDLGSVIGWISSSVGADLYMDNFGYFTAEPTVAPDVEILGVQESAVDAGTFDARIVCGVNDLLFRELKFHYNALENGNYHWTDEQVADVTEVYTTIQIDGIADAEATTFGYNYLAALTIQGIPADGVIEITVEMSYVREADLSTELTTALYSIIYIDGVFQSFGIA